MNTYSDSNLYYTFEEAQQILERKKSTFYAEIKKGEIPFISLPNKKIGKLFPKEAIDVIAKRERRERERKNKHSDPLPPLTFEPSTRADIWEAVANARSIYGPDDIIGFERALEWRDRNLDISMSVKQGSQFVGMVTYIPLDEPIIMKLLDDSIREKDIPDQAIREWTDPQLSVYVAGIASVKTKDENKRIDSQRGRFLLRNAIRWAITLTTQYDIKNWYAIGVTLEGKSIAEALGFQEILSREEGERKSYKLESILTQPTKLARRYLKGIESQK